jgi:hypothetical protein
MFPPMTQEEIEDWMEHIPVFAVTDSNGAGVVLKPDDSSSVFYFFLNPLAANATMGQLNSVNKDMDLKVSAFSLGKIWFKLLNADPDQEVMVRLEKVRSCGLGSSSLLFSQPPEYSSRPLDQKVMVKLPRVLSTVLFLIPEIFSELVCC